MPAPEGQPTTMGSQVQTYRLISDPGNGSATSSGINGGDVQHLEGSDGLERAPITNYAPNFAEAAHSLCDPF